MARKGGPRRKSKQIFTKKTKEKGKVTIRRHLAEFKEGEKVALIVEPSQHAGMYHPRFVGKTGTVKAKTGSCYEVQITDINKEKTLIVHPVHMKKI